MKPETRNLMTDGQHLRSPLTPSELAALLGPTSAPVVEPAPAVAEPSATRWRSFGEGFSQRLTTHLRSLLRSAVRVTFSGSRTIAAESHSSVLEPRSHVSLWQSAGSIEPIAVVLSVPLVTSFVDRLLGGRSAPLCDDSDSTRPLTEVDQRLASRLVTAALQSLSNQTETASSMELTELPGTVDSLVDAWLPDSALVRMSFDLRFVHGGGTLDVLLPIEFAESCADLPEEPEMPQSAAQPTAMESPKTPSRRSVVVAQLSQTALPESDLRALAVGDVLLMPTRWDQSVRVLVDGLPEMQGFAGSSGGHKAIRLTNTSSVRPS